MSFFASMVIVYGFAGLLLGGALSIATGLFAWHRRRSRIAGYALDASVPLVEGAALLVGVVESIEEGHEEPVIAVEVTAGGLLQITAVAFSLRLPSGALVLVEPEADPARLTLDQAYQLGPWSRGRTYCAAIRPGESVHLRANLRRELDPHRAGSGYRDRAQVWTARAPLPSPLAIIAPRVIALHAERARFHGRWALGLGALFIALNTAVLGPFHLAVLLARATPQLAWGAALLTLASSVLAAFTYWRREAETKPWMEHTLKR
jgi:hypothetical protein